MRGVVLLVAVLMSAAVHAADLGFSVWTNPKKYLAAFPLGVSQAELYQQLGAPQRTFDLGAGRAAWVYERGEGFGLRTFTFEIVGGAVRDVRFNQQGAASWNNLTATQAQGVTENAVADK